MDRFLNELRDVSVINACGPVTRLGGSVMPPEVLQAFCDAADQAVLLDDLQAAASRRIAALTGTEAGLVTAGASAALTLGAAAILCGHDTARMDRLPDCDGFPCEFLVARDQRTGYDHAVRATGARLVEVGINEQISGAGVRRTEIRDYESAIGPQTAGILYTLSTDSAPPLEDVAAMAREQNLHLLVDAAAELPPRSRLREIPASGADLVAFSGGKAICGPQSTGLLCGKRELISSAALQMLDMDDHPDLWTPPPDLIDVSRVTGMPRHGIGRAMKVSKEEIAALMTALEMLVSGRFEPRCREQNVWIRDLAAVLEERSIACRVREPLSDEQPAVLEIPVDPATGRTARDVCRMLRQGRPSVHVGHAGLSEGLLLIRPECLQAAQMPDLTDALCRVLQPPAE